MFIVGAGDTSVVLYVKLRDSTTGFAKTGLAFGSPGAFASYVRPKAAKIDITLATQTVTGTWSSGGFVEVDATAAPGLYRLDVPDGAFALGVGYVIINIGFTGVLAESLEVILDPMPDITTGLVVGDAANTPTTFKTNLTSAVDDFYKDIWFLVRSGTGAVQLKQISAYNGTTKFVTLGSPLTATLSNNDSFVLVNR